MKFDEHCQRLSITIPLNTKSNDNLPVMVWIHGGSNVTGAGDHPMYNPAALVQEQNVIVVTVTYRLGLLGYLGSKNGTPANLGLLDQIEALRWVKKNIARFGGDPDNVTVFGQSSGGAAVAHLMISQGTDGLFKRAIIQSTPFGLLHKRNGMTNVMVEEAKHFSLNGLIEDVILAQKRIEEKVKSFGLKSSMPFDVQFGYFPLPDEKNINQAWRKVSSKIDILIGYNNREVTSFIPLIPKLKRLPLPKFTKEVLVKALTHKIYGSGVKKFAKRHHLGGGRGYTYKFHWGVPKNQFSGGHAIEIPLLFEDQSLWSHSQLFKSNLLTEFNRRGQALRQIWGEFARTG